MGLIDATALLETGFLLPAAAVGLHPGTSSAIGSVTLVFFTLPFTATLVRRTRTGV